MIYYIADMHFGHTNVLRFDNRPFSDTAQMDDTLIQNWNERVATDDTVYVLGDAFWKNEENSIRIIQQLRQCARCVSHVIHHVADIDQSAGDAHRPLLVLPLLNEFPLACIMYMTV